MDFTLNLTLDELIDRTSNERLKPIHLVTNTDECYTTLSQDDKMVLCHLVRAGSHLEKVYYKLDCEENLEFLEYLNNHLDSKECKLTKILFLAQKSIVGVDTEGEEVLLAKGDFDRPGKGFYPKDLTTDEFVSIVAKMLDQNLVDDLKSIFTVRSVVVRNGEFLKGIDYVDYFKEEFLATANELELALKYCHDLEFCEYLKLQIKALKEANPLLDAYADIKWASMQNSKFEFTITRESYEDKMSIAVLEHADIVGRLSELDIQVYAKDSIGIRVGLVNKAGTDFIHKLSSSVNIARKLMPYQDEYKKSKSHTDSKQVVADVDLIALFGDVGAYSGGITIAENLPNVDKLSLSMGGGNRNVYHRQVRMSKTEKRAEALLTSKDQKYYDSEAAHWMTICHENTHSLGPDGSSLGKYSHIIEELKADMGAYAFLHEFVESGVFTFKEAKKIVVTGACDDFLKGKPNLSQAHRVRSVMITNRYLEDGAISFDSDFKLHVDYNLLIESSKAQLADMVRLQLDGKVSKAKEYIDKYFKWTDSLDKVATILKQSSKALNGKLIESLKDDMLIVSFTA